ncbi:hypothetical protein CHGG_10348 [Chaetomium globosum CBS 148.51]|uniref:Phytocyanin domain-containing protein n=1 Tax=Chaetomium globosum (strain ATCC 6205 / CBS 148.51 / DSM 1962 / NBRC 6347 / NRRL 1970) TaxID=306901 RepID=Q2GNV6_CHAGB|nr:uncharacterized protein CHGG_10348 [Chaetomium globosum CBS 148.51]EAQ83944.1 hypothetical protein CHGG_10348 [Chaetomium globosum CBS 148.51]
MKFSTATAMVLGMAPLALGKAVRNAYPVRRDGHKVVAVSGGGKNSVQASEQQLAELARLIGLNRGSGTSINFLWVNIGGGAATTVVGEAQTVTVTQTVGGGAGATPPARCTVGAGGATHSVTVGGPQGLSFNPQQISAAIGDTVIFSFLSQNHTATQSAFDTPCAALDGGMDSGYQANPNNTVNPPPQVAMQVMVDTPLWFYCRQGNHCGNGMVFSINPTAEKTHAQFQALAIQQNGKGAGGAITGNPPNADPNAGTGGAADASSAIVTPPGATPTDAAGAVNTGIATGVGQVGADGSCVCAVQCSVGGFPNQAVQGRDSFGGFGGAIPMAMVEPAARKA